MYRYLLVIIISFISINAYSAFLPEWLKSNKDDAEPEVVKEETQEWKPYHKVLFKAQNEDGTRVFFVFRVLENDVVPVGVIDESQMEIFNLNPDGTIKSSFNWKSNEKEKQAYIDQHFPKATELVIPKK